MHVVHLTEIEERNARRAAQVWYDDVSSRRSVHPVLFDTNALGFEGTWARGFLMNATAAVAVSRLTATPWNDANIPERHPLVGQWYLRTTRTIDGLLNVRADEEPLDGILLHTVVENWRRVAVYGWLTIGEVTRSPNTPFFRQVAREKLRCEHVGAPLLVPNRMLHPLTALPGLPPWSVAARCACRFPLGFPTCGWCGGWLDAPPPPPLDPFTGART